MNADQFLGREARKQEWDEDNDTPAWEAATDKQREKWLKRGQKLPGAELVARAFVLASVPPLTPPASPNWTRCGRKSLI